MRVLKDVLDFLDVALDDESGAYDPPIGITFENLDLFDSSGPLRIRSDVGRGVV